MVMDIFFSTFTMNYIPLVLSYNLFKSFDQGWNKYFAGQDMYTNLKKNCMFAQFLQNNNMKIYLILIILWLIVLFLILLV